MTPAERIVVGRFPLGQILVTREAVDRLTPEEVVDGPVRHAAADWGDISPEDAAENELALREGLRLLSAYGRGEHRYWVITEADRSATTILLPDDY
jgi:hypothetical protein